MQSSLLNRRVLFARSLNLFLMDGSTVDAIQCDNLSVDKWVSCVVHLMTSLLCILRFFTCLGLSRLLDMVPIWQFKSYDSSKVVPKKLGAWRCQACQAQPLNCHDGTMSHRCVGLAQHELCEKRIGSYFVVSGHFPYLGNWFPGFASVTLWFSIQ